MSICWIGRYWSDTGVVIFII